MKINNGRIVTFCIFGIKFSAFLKIIFFKLISNQNFMFLFMVLNIQLANFAFFKAFQKNLFVCFMSHRISIYTISQWVVLQLSQIFVRLLMHWMLIACKINFLSEFIITTTTRFIWLVENHSSHSFLRIFIEWHFSTTRANQKLSYALVSQRVLEQLMSWTI